MKRTQLISLARRVLSLPTAPYHEQFIADFIRRECDRLGVKLRVDKFGNLIVRYRLGQSLRNPLAFVAHMDHPGFEILQNWRNRGARAEFLGTVPRECFPGAPVRIFGDGTVRGHVARIESWDPKHIVRLKLNGPAQRGDFAMWDLKPVETKGDRLRARAVDDVVGCIALLGALSELAANKARTDVLFVFTRAEEVGFHGALALARSGDLSRSVRIVSVETSKEIPPRARMGGGPIVRVGDRAAVFDSELTRYLAMVGEELRKRDQRFQYQRCLMDGGTCEATAFGENGYQAGGLCIALGNYHNIGPRCRIAEEFVSISDLLNLVRLIVGAVENFSRYAQLVRRLRHRLDVLHEAAVQRLLPSFNLLA